ncbi:hypothetical protein NL676_017267 [Syzygium grande]|nr:hypothetical protein NL676_017267 [Syzygium grande]
MANRSAEEIPANDKQGRARPHPDAFHVSGPRHLSCPNWRHLISSAWKDGNYKRTVMACFIQSVYLLELDRQENRSEENALAPNWWLPFKFKLVQTLIDERDGSIFGALLEWDTSAAVADFILLRPSGVPKAVLALRGTLVKSPTICRDIEDGLQFLALESLKGSVRYTIALEMLKSVAQKYGSRNVCVAGHSLGAGFALQVGKALAKEGIYVDAHLFNPPPLSLAMSLRNIGEKAGDAWKKCRSMFSSNENKAIGAAEERNPVLGLNNWVSYFYGNKNSSTGMQKWVPHLYVNNSDYICCYYTDPNKDARKEDLGPENGHVAAKLFVMSKGKQKFLEAHGLEQWWSNDLVLQLSLHNSKLISRQLRNLYHLPATQNPQRKAQ